MGWSLGPWAPGHSNCAVHRGLEHLGLTLLDPVVGGLVTEPLLVPHIPPGTLLQSSVWQEDAAPELRDPSPVGRPLPPSAQCPCR